MDSLAYLKDVFLTSQRWGYGFDLGSVTALQSAISSKIKARTKFKDHFKWKESTSQGEPVDSGNDHGHPTLAMSFQQQVIVPLRACIDSRVSVDPRNLKLQPSVQEIVYGIHYPSDVSGASKLCTLQRGRKAWLSFEYWRDDTEFPTLYFVPVETAQQALKQAEVNLI